MKRAIFIFVAIIIAILVYSLTRTEVIIRNLPAPITEYVKTKMQAFAISKAFKVDSKGVITFEILVVKGSEKQVLIFDRNGKFLKKGDKEAMDAMEKKYGPPNPSKQTPQQGKKSDPKSGSQKTSDDKNIPKK
jgi:hypothetical protein